MGSRKVIPLARSRGWPTSEGTGPRCTFVYPGARTLQLGQPHPGQRPQHLPAASVLYLTLSTLSPWVFSRVFDHFRLSEHPLCKTPFRPGILGFLISSEECTAAYAPTSGGNYMVDGQSKIALISLSLGIPPTCDGLMDSTPPPSHFPRLLHHLHSHTDLRQEG